VAKIKELERITVINDVNYGGPVKKALMMEGLI